jgi:CRISPR-associated protein Cas5d
VTYTNMAFCLEVRSDYACFTRPEMKVERVSYDVITPSAARGVFTAIFWKPAVRWHVRRIEVLEPIRWTSVRRNEVGKVASVQSSGILIEEDRQQRAGLFLRDVAYRLHAELEFVPPPKRPRIVRATSETVISVDERSDWSKDENPGKYNAIFERRARKGQCFNQPYLGCREFSCGFRLVDDPTAEARPIDETRDLGFMLYDLDYSDENNPKPAFWRAHMTRGVIDVPAWESDEVRK